MPPKPSAIRGDELLTIFALREARLRETPCGGNSETQASDLVTTQTGFTYSHIHPRRTLALD